MRKTHTGKHEGNQTHTDEMIMFKQGKRKINTKTFFFSSFGSRRRRTREGIGRLSSRGKINLHKQERKRKRRREEVDLFAEAPRHLSRWGGNDSALCVLFYSPQRSLIFLTDLLLLLLLLLTYSFSLKRVRYFSFDFLLFLVCGLPFKTYWLPPSPTRGYRRQSLNECCNMSGPLPKIILHLSFLPSSSSSSFFH